MSDPRHAHAPLAHGVLAGGGRRRRARSGTDGIPPARAYQRALFEAGIPATAFITSDIDAEYRRLKSHGVVFRGEPKAMGPITAAIFEDTCGNLINLVQPVG